MNFITAYNWELIGAKRTWATAWLKREKENSVNIRGRYTSRIRKHKKALKQEQVRTTPGIKKRLVWLKQWWGGNDTRDTQEII
jgi:hypothetical protein